MVEVTPTHMMAEALASTLRTTGVSAPSGRRPETRDTASRTSEVAASGSRETSNSMETEERSFWLWDVIWRMPSMPATAPSMISVTRLSITSFEAPR